MMALPEVTGILIQKMISGRELFCGATREGRFGHLVMAGMGGSLYRGLQGCCNCTGASLRPGGKVNDTVTQVI